MTINIIIVIEIKPPAQTQHPRAALRAARPSYEMFDENKYVASGEPRTGVPSSFCSLWCEMKQFTQLQVYSQRACGFATSNTCFLNAPELAAAPFLVA